MLKLPASKYAPFSGPELAHREWPSRRIMHAPIWLSTDLRDGNQALFEPMDGARKLRLFRTLVELGFKEIEVAFPAASQTDFDFTRTLIEGRHIPDDVTIMVMTQARAHLIERTFEALQGVPRAIISLYNATAPVWRRDVFGMSQEAVKGLAVTHAQQVADLMRAHPQTQWTLQYSPECFSATELPFAAEVCNAVIDVVQPGPGRPMIINLPATVEVSTPNVFADQVEWMHTHLHRREHIVLSVHPHNDRGTAVAAAELALMAGAQRVEGCLFGHGERSGNVDLVTLALNLYTQGIDPGLDFSNIDHTVRVVEQCSQLPVHPRHPYAGELVYTAFSGSHQDAIRKGLAARQHHTDTGLHWEVPYLPIDPADLGRHYASVIRVNSQSGKGGVAYLLETTYGLRLPRRMLIDFSHVVQQHSDRLGAEIDAPTLLEWWCSTYLERQEATIRSHDIRRDGALVHLRLSIDLSAEDGSAHARTLTLYGTGEDLVHAGLDALRRGLDWPLHLTALESDRGPAPQDGDAPRHGVVMVETSPDQRPGRCWGAGQHQDPDRALLQALVNSAGAWVARLRPQATRSPHQGTMTPFRPREAIRAANAPQPAFQRQFN